MIHPQPPAILGTVLESIDSVLRPGLEAKLAQATPETVSQDKLLLSTVITMRHMLKLIALRLDRDAVMQGEELDKLEPVVAIVGAFLRADGSEAAKALQDELEVAALSPGANDARDRGANERGGQVARLRAAIEHVLRWLTCNRAALQDRSGYADCRLAIRDYVGWQLEQEMQVVDLAMGGPDFRR